MILRGPRPSDNFAQISNAALADEHLSFRARGVLAYLLSRPVGWSSSADALSEHAKEGRDAVRTALNELVAQGYLIRTRRQNSGGQWITDVHVMDAPTTDSQASVNQPSVDQGVKTKKDTQEELPIPPTPRKRGARKRTDYSADFEAWLDVYPRRESKQTAARAFEAALERTSYRTLLQAARRYADDPNRDPAFTKHPATWLNNDGWLDPPLPPRPGSRPTAQSLHDQTMALAASFDIRPTQIGAS